MLWALTERRERAAAAAAGPRELMLDQREPAARRAGLPAAPTRGARCRWPDRFGEDVAGQGHRGVAGVAAQLPLRLRDPGRLPGDRRLELVELSLLHLDQREKILTRELLQPGHEAELCHNHRPDGDPHQPTPLKTDECLRAACCGQACL
jgi:hypothetical protein